MRLRAALALGRISNLPTVWSNGLAGLVLAGGAATEPATLPLLVALSLLYVAGMYLSDWLDRDIDVAQHHGKGAAAPRTAASAGFGMIAAAILILLATGLLLPGGNGPWPAVGGAALALAIMAYGTWHKQQPLSPLLMGLCRVLAYLTAGLVVTSTLPAPLLLGGGALFCYLIGLGHVADQATLERARNLWPLAFLAAPAVYAGIVAFGTLTGVALWLTLVIALGAGLRLVHRRQPGDIGRAVALLSAGIAILDALLIAGTGSQGTAWLALAGFPLTLVLQRHAPGT